MDAKKSGNHKKTLLIITKSFPYLPGEQFLEDEAPFWSRTRLFRVIILPKKIGKACRWISDDITVNEVLAKNSRTRIITSLIRAILTITFIKELTFQVKLRKISRENIWNSLAMTAEANRAARHIINYSRTHGKIDLVYCYWNGASAYGACLAKKRGAVTRVVSRAHRYDLYELGRNSYLPLKRQIVKEIDAIATLSNSASQYMIEKYGVHQRKLVVQPLGVPVPSRTSNPSPKGKFHIVSVSYCVPVKRIDKIIDSLAIFANRHSSLRVFWTHIGDGPCRAILEDIAHNKLRRLNNMRYLFKGDVENRDVKSFYLDNNVDLFVNASDSEGMPVSIMEAMACAVPVVAPDTGAMSDLVSSNVGVLLPERPDPEQIADAITSCCDSEKRYVLGRAARKVIMRNFNSKLRYTGFMKWLERVGS